MNDAKKRIEEVEAKRAARKAELSGARDTQLAVDLEALDALECEHGDGKVERLNVDRFVPGHPTFIVLRAPSSALYKRFCDQVSRAAKNNDPGARRAAENALGESCWIYPAEAERKAMLEEFPGLLLSVAIRAAKLVEASEAEEGKG